MTHHRSLIRQTAVDVIVAAGTEAGTHVYNSRTRDLVLPAITVFTDPDELGDDGPVMQPANTRQIRNLVMRVEIRAAETIVRRVHDSMDLMEEEVSRALYGDVDFNRLLEQQIIWTGADFEFSDEGDRQIGLNVVSFLCRYRVDAANPVVEVT